MWLEQLLKHCTLGCYDFWSWNMLGGSSNQVIAAIL
jgi:hypothetical protein